MPARKAKSKAAEPKVIEIKSLARTTTQMVIVGDTPLIVHAWSQKARLEMLANQMGIKFEAPRELKDPYDDFIRSIYRTDNGAYGFPATGIKEALATASIGNDIAKADIYRNVFVNSVRGHQAAAFCDLISPTELVELFSPNAPTMREDMVRLSGPNRTADLRYRAEFWPWAMRVRVSFFPAFISESSIANLLHQAGARIGIGEWRNEKGGTYGTFHLSTDRKEMADVEKWISARHKEPADMTAGIAAWLSRLQIEAAKRTVDAANAAKAVEAAEVPKARRRGNGTASTATP